MQLVCSRCLAIAIACLSLGGVAYAQQASAGDAAPLPDARELMQRALASEKKIADEQERYDCQIAVQGIETDKKGNVKRTETATMERFFVNGIPIDRTLSKNGKALSPEQAADEDKRVMKETVKLSNRSTAQKESDKRYRMVEDVLEAMMLTNGRRDRVSGRSVLSYDIVPNPNYEARNLNQRFAQAMVGKILIDEQSGEVIDLDIRSTQDLKIAGGLVAVLHKGFWVHAHNQPQPDGVWLTKLVEGSGDLRAALFYHPYFRFKETAGDCRLYSVAVGQAGQANPLEPKSTKQPPPAR